MEKITRQKNLVLPKQNMKNHTSIKEEGPTSNSNLKIIQTHKKKRIQNADHTKNNDKTYIPTLYKIKNHTSAKNSNKEGPTKNRHK